MSDKKTEPSNAFDSIFQTSKPDMTTNLTQTNLPEIPPQDMTAKDLVLPEPEGSLTTTSRYEPFRLQLAEPLHLRDRDWHTAVVSRERGTWGLIDSKYVVVGDCKYTPQDIHIAPGTITADPE